MKRYFLLGLASLLTLRSYAQQSPALPVRQTSFTDGDGQRVAFTLPRDWQFDGSVISDKQGRKVGEFIPRETANCPYKSGPDYLKALRAGSPEDPHPRFVGSRTLVLGPTTWTEGVLDAPAWDGRSNTGRWYAHYFFTLLNRRCFELVFYSQQRQLPQEETFKKILASVKLL